MSLQGSQMETDDPTTSYMLQVSIGPGFVSMIFYFIFRILFYDRYI